jgi:hypothetical protein
MIALANHQKRYCWRSRPPGRCKAECVCKLGVSSGFITREHDFAISGFCALSHRPKRRCAHSGHHDGLIPCQFEHQSGLTWPKIALR